MWVGKVVMLCTTVYRVFREGSLCSLALRRKTTYVGSGRGYQWLGLGSLFHRDAYEISAGGVGRVLVWMENMEMEMGREKAG